VSTTVPRRLDVMNLWPVDLTADPADVAITLSSQGALGSPGADIGGRPSATPQPTSRSAHCRRPTLVGTGSTASHLRRALKGREATSALTAYPSRLAAGPPPIAVVALLRAEDATERTLREIERSSAHWTVSRFTVARAVRRQSGEALIPSDHAAILPRDRQYCEIAS
jgi:hypothetical protein